MPDLSLVCDLNHSSQRRWILNPLSEAKNGTHILMDTSQVLNPLSHNGNSSGVTFEFPTCDLGPRTRCAERWAGLQLLHHLVLAPPAPTLQKTEAQGMDDTVHSECVPKTG